MTLKINLKDFFGNFCKRDFVSWQYIEIYLLLLTPKVFIDAYAFFNKNICKISRYLPGFSKYKVT